MKNRASSSVPGYWNKTFHKLDYIVDIFFSPYKNTNALYYIMSQSRTEQQIRRIRFTGSNNRSPVANTVISDTTASIGQVIAFNGSKSYDTDCDSLTFEWDFGDHIATSIPIAKTARTACVQETRNVQRRIHCDRYKRSSG
jgi:hypothetical protein